MRKAICVILAAFMLTCLGPRAALAAGPAERAFSPWAEVYLSDAGMYDILPDELRSGDYTGAVTRGDFCGMAYDTMRYIAAYMDSKFLISEEPPERRFRDTDDPAIRALCEEGILKGRGNGVFAPDGLLTREEAAAILARMAAYFDLQTFENKLRFSDAGSISDWASEGVDTVCGMGLMNGMGDGSFAPGGNYTKEQSIATMVRLINCVPFLNNREEIAEDRFFIFNFFHLWIENGEGDAVFELPYQNQSTQSGYHGLDFFTRDGKLLGAAFAYDFRSSEIFDIESGEKLLAVPGVFYALTKDGKDIIVYETRYAVPTVDAAYSVYGVYDFDGNELVPVGADWSDLYERGYVDTASSVFYIWK